MARIRQFKPSFFTDDKVGRLSRDARLFFFGVLSEADDEGRLVDSPKRLAGVVFPFDDDVTPKKVERWINELAEQQMVVRYTHGGGRFLYVRKFKDHQKMSHPTPSSLPPPPSGSGQSSGDPPEKLRNGAGEPPEGFAPEGVLVFEGVEVGVFEGVPSGSSSSSKPDRAATESAEEEELRDRVTTAARLVAERRLAARTGPPLTNATAWLRKVRAEVLTDHGSELAEMAAQGRHPKAMADRIMPPPPRPYGDVDEPLPPAWDLDDHAFAVPRSVGA